MEHPGDEAQLDFGPVQIAQNGRLVERKILTASFPFINATFAFHVPSENGDCFLEALKRLFEQMSGVPRRVWFDNLTAVVASIDKNGDRKMTDAFARFCAHYRFEPIFCHVASGNEKGNVENKVGYGRRNWGVFLEVGFVPFHQTGAELLVHVISECYEQRSLIVTSNLEFGQWNSVFGDTVLTNALVNRLVHHAHILSFTGESYRLRHALSNLNS